MKEKSRLLQNNKTKIVLLLILTVIVTLFGLLYISKAWQQHNSQSGINKQMLQCAVMAAGIIALLALFYRVKLSNHQLSMMSQELKKTEILFRTGFQQAPIGIALVDRFYAISMGNKEFARILGRSRGEITSLNWRDIIHPDELDKDLDLLERSKNKEKSERYLEMRFVRPDGTVVWVNMTVSKLHLVSEDTLNEYYLCMVQDIQARKEGEEALRESERSKRVLLENLPGMAYRCKYDEEWTMEFVSKGCYDLTGYKDESLLYNKELSFNDLIAPEYREVLREEWARVVEERSLFRYE